MDHLRVIMFGVSFSCFVKELGPRFHGNSAEGFREQQCECWAPDKQNTNRSSTLRAHSELILRNLGTLA